MDTKDELTPTAPLALERRKAIVTEHANIPAVVVGLLESNAISETLLEKITEKFLHGNELQRVLQRDTANQMKRLGNLGMERRDQAHALEDLLFAVFEACQQHGFQDPLQKHHDYFVLLWKWIHEKSLKPKKPDFTYGSLPTAFDLPHNDRFRWRN